MKPVPSPVRQDFAEQVLEPWMAAGAECIPLTAPLGATCLGGQI